MKDIAKRAFLGMGMALSIFCLFGIIFDLIGAGTFTLDNYQFTKMVIGCMFVGLGFGAPTVIYNVESLPMPIRIIIHMGIGCIIYTVVAFAVGWATTDNALYSVLAIVGQLGVAFVIWFLFMMHYRTEAKKLNAKIQAMK